jgi:regulator of protease activity HflC (stomatin/prohibitin superfamily)
MFYWILVLVFVFIILPGFRVVQQYQKGVVFLLGKITGIKEPGLSWIIPYYQVVDVIKSIVAIENVMSAINQIAQTTMRNIVGRFQLDEILSERDRINAEIRTVLDIHTEPWGVVVSLVEIKDIELPENMQRAMAKQAEAEREKRAKIIAAEGEFLSVQKLSEAADVIAQHPIALQLRNLQTMAEISVEKNSTIIFPAQFMSTVKELNKFIQGEQNTKNY